MLHGTEMNGAIGRISYTEFYDVGQGSIISRYPIHFHHTGDMLQSFVEGCSVYESQARLVTLHGTRYL